MTLFCALLLWQLGLGRLYHRMPLADVARTTHTHVETCGLVVYVRHQEDGDWHVTLTSGEVKLVAELIPAIPLAVPQKGQTIVVRGISRIDKGHGGWAEIHPVESWHSVPVCEIGA